MNFVKEKITIPLVVLNIISNLINFLVFTRLRFRKVSVGFYFAGLAIANIFCSIIVIYYYLIYIYSIRVFEGKRYFSFLFYFSSTVSFYSAWFSVLVSLDGCLCVISVKLMNTLKKRVFQVILVACIIVALSLVNIQIWKNDNINPITRRDYYFDDVYPYVELLISSFLPFLLMCAFNITTVILLKRSKGKLRTQRRIKKSGDKENRFLITSIALNILFFFTFLPKSIVQIWIISLFYKSNENASQNILFKHIMALHLDQLFAYWKMIYFFTHIFIYYGVNRIYRNELNDIIKRLIFCKKN